MKVLLADKLADHARTALASSGLEVLSDPSLAGDGLTETLTSFDPDILVVRSTRVTSAHLRAGRALSLVVRAGAGVSSSSRASQQSKPLLKLRTSWLSVKRQGNVAKQ